MDDLDLQDYVTATTFHVPKEDLDLSKLTKEEIEKLRGSIASLVTGGTLTFDHAFMQQIDPPAIHDGLRSLIQKERESFFGSADASLRREVQPRWMERLALVKPCTYYNFLSGPFQQEDRFTTASDGVTLRQVVSSSVLA